MKYPKTFAILLCAAGLGSLPTTTQAQFGNSAPSGVSAALLQLFGEHKAFTAKVDVQVLDKAQKESVRLPAEVALSGNKLRIDIDLSLAKGRDMPEFAIDSLKQVGMSRLTAFIRPDKKSTYLVYPGAESYLNMPMEKSDAEAAEKGYKTEITPLGKDLVGTNNCVKNKVLVKTADRTALEATTWNATEQKNFPIKIETREKENALVMMFRDIKFVKPEDKQFDMPAGFTGYDSPQAMMMGLMKKIAGSTESSK